MPPIHPSTHQPVLSQTLWPYIRMCHGKCELHSIAKIWHLIFWKLSASKQKAGEREKSGRNENEMEMAVEFEEHCHQNIIRMANIFDLFLIRDHFSLDVVIAVVAGLAFGRFV